MEHYNRDCNVPEYHALLTVQLGQLIESGSFDWNAEPLASAFEGLVWKDGEVSRNDDKIRLQNMFDSKFYWREISITPPGQWRQMLVHRIKFELVPKYRPMYDAVREGNIDPLVSSDEYYKERSIRSDFPETALAGTSQVYASEGDDREFERLKVDDAMAMMGDYYERFVPVDVAFMRELEIFFTDMYALHENLL